MSNIIFIEYPTTYWSDLLNELHDQLNFEVYFIEPIAKHYKFNIEELKNKAHYDFHYLKRIHIFNREISLGIFPIIRKCKPHYIITREFSIITALLAVKKKIFGSKYKIIVRCDDSYDMVSNKHEFSAIHRYARKILMPLVDNIILVEPRVVDWYYKRYQKGILFPILRKDSDYRNKLFQTINVSNQLIDKYELKGKKVIAFIGRFVKLKNIDILLQIFTEINDPNTILFLIGDGEEKQSLEQKYKNAQIIFTGNLQGANLLAYYNIISILVLLSDREAFGAVVNEALLSGAKVLVSERAGASFLVNHSNGAIVNPYNKVSVKNKLKQLIDETSPTSYLSNIRPNNMHLSFYEAINTLIEGINKTN